MQRHFLSPLLHRHPCEQCQDSSALHIHASLPTGVSFGGMATTGASCCRWVPCLALSCKPGTGFRTLYISFLKGHHHYKCVNGFKLYLDKNLKKEWTFSPLGGLKDTLRIKESPHQKLYRAISHPRQFFFYCKYLKICHLASASTYSPMAVGKTY